jgi:hypothetical protein
MLPQPAHGLGEATRTLRPGGRLGTVTWATEEPSLAGKTWDATLDEFSAPALPAHSNHAGLDTAESVSSHLIAAGLVPDSVWYETTESTFDPDDFWRLRTTHGTNAVRLARLDADHRQSVLEELAKRLADLERSAYRVGGTLVCSISTKPTDGGHL